MQGIEQLAASLQVSDWSGGHAPPRAAINGQRLQKIATDPAEQQKDPSHSRWRQAIYVYYGYSQASIMTCMFNGAHHDCHMFA
jgi:hypothetical protein